MSPRLNTRLREYYPAKICEPHLKGAMRFLRAFKALVFCISIARSVARRQQDQTPLLHHAQTGRDVSVELFAELEELARVVDITYCVGLTSFGIIKPFQCLSRCSDFPDFELVTTWNTGALLSDSCGYIALDHGKQRIVVAFRGTYSVANTVVDLSTIPQKYESYPRCDDDDEHSQTQSSINEDIAAGKADSKCKNCTVHTGFHTAWRNTRSRIMPDLRTQLLGYPKYQLILVGHSAGGAVAALAGLELRARGWNPIITTFGEPRLGNQGLVDFIDSRFDLDETNRTNAQNDDMELKYRRVTHVEDPVPLLPLTEWGYSMHAGEIYISKPDLSPDVSDVEHCIGDADPDCVAGQDSTVQDKSTGTSEATSHAKDLLASVKDEVQDVLHESWGIPSRYKLWQLFFAHRDYFWRLGLCVPSVGPSDGDGKYEDPKIGLR